MMQEKLWGLHLDHILVSIDRIMAYQLRGDLDSDSLVFDGTLRNLHTLSESTKHIPEYIKDQYPQINWKAIIVFRNFIVHDYLGDNINISQLKRVIKERLPELQKVINHIVKNHPPI